MDPVKSASAALFETVFGLLPRWSHERRQKGRLKKMLADDRFEFRSTQQLMDGIGADQPTTERLLLAIGARRSETSDHWTLSEPGKKRVSTPAPGTPK